MVFFLSLALSTSQIVLGLWLGRIIETREKALLLHHSVDRPAHGKEVGTGTNDDRWSLAPFLLS